MDYDELEKLLQGLNIAVVPKGLARVRGHDMDIYRALARQTGTIDYDCDFRNGECRSMASGDRVCCLKCAATFGYWCKEPAALDEDTVKTMARFWDARTGFMRDNAGCILPRELRSPTCLYIFCSDAKMSGADRELLYRIQYGANWG